MRDEGVKFTGCIVSRIKMNKTKPYAVILTGYSSGERAPRRKQAHIGTFKTKKEAEAERARQIAAMEASTFVPPSDTLMKDYLEFWLKEYVSGGNYKMRNSKVLRIWTREEVERVITAADKMGTRQSAFYHMALETGMRKGELCGLHWGDISLVPGAGEITVRGQLVKAGPNWSIGTPKNGKERQLPISDELVERLIRWKDEQAVIRSVADAYEDHDFVFTRNNGSPLLMNNLGQREFAELIKLSGVRPIRFHDMTP